MVVIIPLGQWLYMDFMAYRGHQWSPGDTYEKTTFLSLYITYMKRFLHLKIKPDKFQ